MKPEYHLETKVLHTRQDPHILGAANMPVFHSTMFESAGETRYDDVPYLRLNNSPNHQFLNKKLAALEDAEAGLVTASGMAAISTTVLTVLQNGDHLLGQQGLYGGTHTFITRELPRFGISVDLVDATQPDTWKEKLRPNTRAIYVESMTNPCLEVADLKSVVRFAREYGLTSIIDNTFATPVNFRAVAFGFNICLHSCTKYLNGHSDLVAGLVLGTRDQIERIRHLLNHMGGTLDPHACYLLYRGLKTLAVRIRHQNESALQIARYLQTHPAIERVNYPGLETHPQYQRARELFSGFSALISFEMKNGVRAADALIESLEIPLHAVSLGGTESLVTRPSATSHAGLSNDEKRRAGISDGLVRLSVGLESTEDLIEDFRQALAKMD